MRLQKYDTSLQLMQQALTFARQRIQGATRADTTVNFCSCAGNLASLHALMGRLELAAGEKVCQLLSADIRLTVLNNSYDSMYV